MENANTKSELKRSSLKTKEMLSLSPKPPVTYSAMQGLLLSLAKPSKQKELAIIKLRACVRAIQRKLSLLTLPAKINCVQRLQFQKQLTPIASNISLSGNN